MTLLAHAHTLVDRPESAHHARALWQPLRRQLAAQATASTASMAAVEVTAPSKLRGLLMQALGDVHELRVQLAKQVGLQWAISAGSPFPALLNRIAPTLVVPRLAGPAFLPRRQAGPLHVD